MAGAWYFAENGKTVGPVLFEDAVQKVRLSPDILVWQEGLDHWTAARSIPEFAAVLKASPPPLPPQPLSEVSVAPPPIPTSATVPLCGLHPWRRFFARTFDNSLFAVIVGIIFSAVIPEVFDQKSSDQALAIVAVTLYIPVEGILLLSFGRSLGKILYGIHLSPRQEFTVSTALKRSILVWWRGLGIGFPIISLFTVLTAHRRLKNTGVTSWDNDMNISVTHGRLSVGRWLIIAIAWIIVLIPVVIGVSVPDR